eukprot:1326191-Amphidinium_carterae.2
MWPVGHGGRCGHYQSFARMSMADQEQGGVAPGWPVMLELQESRFFDTIKTRAGLSTGSFCEQLDTFTPSILAAKDSDPFLVTCSRKLKTASEPSCVKAVFVVLN